MGISEFAGYQIRDSNASKFYPWKRCCRVWLMEISTKINSFLPTDQISPRDRADGANIRTTTVCLNAWNFTFYRFRNSDSDIGMR